ncbi:death-associated inhibitor of apoptosis 1-like isoform X2 [Ornithodoros turicata]
MLRSASFKTLTQLHHYYKTREDTTNAKSRLCRDGRSCHTGREVEPESGYSVIFDDFKLLPNELNLFLEHYPPKSIEWMHYSKRLRSYGDGQVIPKKKRGAFAYFGFFLTGNITTCFHCGGCHADWTDTDEPFVEHCRWFPECQFIRFMEGDYTVNYIRGQHEKHMKTLEDRGRQEAEVFHKALVEDLLDNEDIKFYEEHGVSVELLHLAATSVGHHEHVTADDIIQEVSKLSTLELPLDWRTIPRNQKGLYPTLVDLRSRHVQDGNTSEDEHPAGPSRGYPGACVSNRVLAKPKYPRFQRFEDRRATFNGFPVPRTDLLNPERLAGAGLFYTNKNDETACFYCGGFISHWDIFDDPYTEHAKWFPSCDYICSAMQGHIVDSEFYSMPPSAQPEAVNEVVHGPPVATDAHGHIADSGFFSMPPSAQPEAANEVVHGPPVAINAHVSETAVADDVSRVTRRPTSDVLGLNSSDQEEEFTMRNSSYTVHPSKPAHPQFVSLTRREMSFESYPRHAKGNKEKMAKAGFFYTGIGDRTTCFQCGNSLWNWDEKDEPLLEHARWYPDCAYVILMVGTATINDIREAHKNTLAERRTAEISQSDEPTNYILQHLMSAPIVYRLTAQGIDRLIVELAILKRLNGTGLIDVLDEEDLRRALTEVVSLPENVRTKEISKADTGDLSKCIVCKTGDRHTIFLPCNHLIACSRCAESCSVCPSCNRQIATRRKAFLA